MDKIRTSEAEIQAMQQYLDAAISSEGRSPSVFVAKIKTLLFGLTVTIMIGLLFSVLTARSRGVTPDILGWQLYQVESGSMAPTLEIGDIILSRRPPDAAALEAGDVITFYDSRNVIVTHRIIEVSTDENGSVRYRTRGDSPDNDPDPDWVYPAQIKAVMAARLPIA